MDLTRKMLRERTAERRGGRRPLCLSRDPGLFYRAGSLQLFQLEFQLLDLAKDLLALRSKEHALQLLDQQHQALDLARPRTQLRLLSPGISVLVKAYRLHRRRIESVQIGRAEGLGHVRSMSQSVAVKEKKAA